MTGLGFVIPEAIDQAAGDAFYASFSAEQIDVLDVDALVWIADVGEQGAIVASPLRNGLNAVKEGREVWVADILAGAMSFSSPLSIPYVLEHLPPELEAAVDGDPATPVPSAQAIRHGVERPGNDDRVSRPAVRLEARDVTLAYDARVVVDRLSVDVPEGEFTVIVGANACGKSTLLRGLARLLTLRGGAVLLDGEPIHRSPTRDVAAKLGILPQQPVAPDGLVVGDLVARGRHPHLRWYRRWSSHDDELVRWALDVTAMTDLATRPVDELSGGQRQRAWIAMALAQDTPTLLLDEPTTFLDLAHQCEVMDLLERLNHDGRTIVAVLHDLNQAARYADHMIAIRDGQVVATGTPAQVVTPELVEVVFGLPVVVHPDPLTGTPMVIPVPQGRRR